MQGVMKNDSSKACLNLAEESLLTPAEKMQKQVILIESMIEHDHEQAVNELIRIVQKPPHQTLDLMQKIVDKCVEQDTLFLAQRLLKNKSIHEHFLPLPDGFFSLILDFIDSIEKNRLQHKDEVRIALLEGILKGFANNRTLSVSLQTKLRIAHHINKVVQTPYFLHKPIPASFISAYKEAFNSLPFALQAQDCHFGMCPIVRHRPPDGRQ